MMTWMASASLTKFPDDHILLLAFTQSPLQFSSGHKHNQRLGGGEVWSPPALLPVPLPPCFTTMS